MSALSPLWWPPARIIATVPDPLAVQAILTHRARSSARAAKPRPTHACRTHVAHSSIILFNSHPFGNRKECHQTSLFRLGASGDA